VAGKRAYDEIAIAEQRVGSKESGRIFEDVKLPSWHDLLPGNVVTDAGNAKDYSTGDWRSERPVWNHDRCIKCGICMLFCPEGCVEQNDQGYFESNYYYCKGCGICARECWTQAITMIEEAKA